MTPEAMKAMRKRLELTQGDLAKLLGLSKRAIANYEGGTRRIPMVVTMACQTLFTNPRRYQGPLP